MGVPSRATAGPRLSAARSLMGGSARLLAAWLMPVTWLAAAAAMLRGGSEGAWLGLVLALAPLLALCVAARHPPAGADPEPRLRAMALVLAVGLLAWANLSLAGDIAADLGGPRWPGAVIAGSPALILLAWPRAERFASAGLVLALIGVGLPLLTLAQAAGMGPLRAWDAVASREAFQFPRRSPWVTDGRVLGGQKARGPMAFDEEHRVTAPGGATLVVATRDLGRDSEREWKLEPGQSITFRPGDRLLVTGGAALRFEAGRRVPGAPPSGPDWAQGGRPVWRDRVGLAVTVLGGAVALLAAPGFITSSRGTAVAAGAALVAAFAWAQAWSVYGALQTPEVFLGGVTLAGLTEAPALAVGLHGPKVQAILLAGLLAAFVASALALGSRAGVAGGRDVGLRAGVLVAATAASLLPGDAWAIAVAGLGVAGSAVAPGLLWPSEPRLAAGASALGLVVFVLLSVLRWVQGPAPGAVGIATAYPAVVAIPAAGALLWLSRRAAPARRP